MVFILAIIIAIAAVVADNLYGHDAIAWVLLGSPFVIPALAIAWGIIEGIFGLFLPKKRDR